MLKVDQYDLIRTSYRVYGKQIKQIARETGHSKNTIKKVLRGEHTDYKARDRQPFPVLEPFLDIIDGWLLADKDRPKKQRHTAVRVYQRLKTELDFTGAETTVRRYVRQAKQRLGLNGRIVYIPSDPEAGIEAEVDWGGCRAIIGGKETRLKFFCMRSKFSGKHFVRCYPCERQQALFDGHIRAFSFFGGVFPVLIYDNLTTAVQRIFRGKKRDLQSSYEKFRAYYNFSPVFCNPGQGHEKGGVEGLVGYARRNYMVPVPEADSLEDLNEKLLAAAHAYGTTVLPEGSTPSASFTKKRRSICSPCRKRSAILRRGRVKSTSIQRFLWIRTGIRFPPSMLIARPALCCMWIRWRFFTAASASASMIGFSATTSGAFNRNIIWS